MKLTDRQLSILCEACDFLLSLVHKNEEYSTPNNLENVRKHVINKNAGQRTTHFEAQKSHQKREGYGDFDRTSKMNSGNGSL